MADLASVTSAVFVAAAVNAIHQYREHGAAATAQTVFANAALFVTLAGVGNFLSWDIAFLLAILYLIATMLTTGGPVIEWFSELVAGKDA